MSLNGLDAAAVQEAYQHANSETGGGWLLLRYASRDSVDLLERGRGGVHDARLAISKYEEKSPLYGLIIYRRRKVLIKYVPDGTSRVLLARTAVHWQDILEKFAPYETVLEISTAEALNDTSLAASFPLHTATPSTSSHRLGEISEDAEDAGSTARPSLGSNASTPTSMSSSVRQRAERRVDQLLRAERSPPPSIRVEDVQVKTPSGAPSAASPRKAHISQFLVRDDSGQRSVTSLSSTSTAPTSQFSTPEIPPKSEDRTRRPETSRIAEPSPASSTSATTAATSTPPSKPVQDKPRVLRGVELLTDKPPPDVRPTSGTERTITRQSITSQTAADTSGKLTLNDDPYDFSQYDYKPKVKLGPRPVAPADKAKRPSVLGSAPLPATYRPTSSKKQESVRPKSTGPISLPPMSPTAGIPAPPPIPDMPEYTPRPISRGSIKSLPSHKSTAMTPDKIRLMKAVELRKKQMRKSNPQAGFVPPPETEVPAVPKVPEAATDEVVSKDPEAKLDPTQSLKDSELAPGKKADSGIAMDYQQADEGTEKEPVRSVPEDSDTQPAEPIETEQSSSGRTVESVAEEPTHDNTSPKVDTPRVGPGGSAGEEDVESSATSITPKATPSAEAAPEVEAVEDAKDKEQDRGLGVSIPESSELMPVPTIVMADGTRPISSSEAKSIPKDEQSDPSDEEEEEEEDGDAKEHDLAAPDQQLNHKNSDIAKRRRGFVEPLHIDPDGGDFSSDDEFMAELQSATLQEARPITVSKSPVAAYFPRRPSATSMGSEVSVRSVNILNRSSTLDFADMQDRLSPDPNHSPRAAITPPMERYDPMAAMRRNVSSGISRRIQALAEHSSRESLPQSPEYSSDRAQSPPVQRETLRSPPPMSSRTNSYKARSRHSARMSSYQKQSNAAAKTQTEAYSSVYSVQENASAKPDSISVSARIVRPPLDERSGSDEAAAAGELYQPQLSINHKRQPSIPLIPVLPPLDTNPASQPEPQSSSRIDSRSNSIASRGASPEMTRSPIEARTLHSAARSTRHKPNSSISGPSFEDFPPPPTHASNASVDENVSTSTGGRTSRFFKRMSNIGSKRKSGMTQSVASSTTSPASERGSLIVPGMGSSTGSAGRDRTETILLGDCNIQFPDSLLWKRRILHLTPTSDLIFSIPQAMDHQRLTAKKFPLSDFRIPYLPDLDRQELPYSVLLDFIEGGTTLQIACEDAESQRRIGGVLRGEWRERCG